MKKNIFYGIAILALATLATVNITLGNGKKNVLNDLQLANVEALANDEAGATKWFSNLNWVECPISKVNGATVIIIRGITIPAYASYTVYGNKQICERELTLNTCNTADQTPCQE
jgi:hypothetical protein